MGERGPTSHNNKKNKQTRLDRVVKQKGDLGEMRGLIAIINIFVQQRWSMRVNGRKLFRDKGSTIENCNGLIRYLGPIFTEVDFPCLRNPAQFVFDHMIVQVGSTEGKAGVDADGVSPDVGDIDAIEVPLRR